MGLFDKINKKLEELSTCDLCGHMDPDGVAGCHCSGTGCACREQHQPNPFGIRSKR